MHINNIHKKGTKRNRKDNDDEKAKSKPKKVKKEDNEIIEINESDNSLVNHELFNNELLNNFLSDIETDLLSIIDHSIVKSSYSLSIENNLTLTQQMTEDIKYDKIFQEF